MNMEQLGGQMKLAKKIDESKKKISRISYVSSLCRTMNRFLDRFTQQYDNMTISSHNNSGKQSYSNLSFNFVRFFIDGKETGEAKLAILRDMLPHVDDQTLKYYLEIYDGNIDAVVQELLN